MIGHLRFRYMQEHHQEKKRELQALQNETAMDLETGVSGNGRANRMVYKTAQICGKAQ